MAADVDCSNEHPDLDAVERIVGHAFSDRALLLTALTHRSFAHECVQQNPACQDNEPLEFLGDAVLAFIVADLLFRSFPGLDEGRLSKHKSVLEKSATLAQTARRLGLGLHVRLGRGERLAWRDGNDSILSDVFEALLGAVYLDGGIDAASAFVKTALAPVVASLDELNPLTDFKSVLQEFAQSRGLGTPRYEVTGEDGPDHGKTFHVEVVIDDESRGQGSGSTKRQAQQEAAQGALESLRSLLAEDDGESLD